MTGAALACHSINSPDPGWTGPQGSIPAQSTTWTITNTGCGSNIVYTMSAPSWITIPNPNPLTIPNNQSRTVTFSVNTANANALAAGTYSGTVSLSGTFGGWTRTITLTVTGGTPVLAVSTATNFTASGPQGGPFPGSPTSYSVTNTGAGTLNWTVAGPSWLTVSPSSGAQGTSGSTTVNVSANASANALGAGTYTGNIVFTNTANSTTVTRTATLTVNDTTPPVIAGTLTNVSINTPPGSATATHTWTAPTASDNVGVTSFTLGLSPGGSQVVTLSNFAFPIGLTTLTYTALDAASNQSQRSFTVTVVDNVAPVFGTCPASQPTVQATSAAGATATWTVPTATDNSGGAVTVTRTAGPAPGSTFPLGATVVTYTATDPSSNTATCTFTITVVDTTPPVVTAPANVTAEATIAAGAVVTYAAATATDLVSPAPVITYSQNSGTSFSLGTTIVTVTARDAANNQSTATFTVTVQDTIAPVITAPANVTAEATSAAGAVVTYAAATATDAVTPSPVITYSQNSGTNVPARHHDRDGDRA